MLSSILQNAITDIRLDGVADAFLTPTGNIAGQFYSNNQTYNFEIIEATVYYHDLNYRQDAEPRKGKRCPRGYWIPKDYKCNTGSMTPSAARAGREIKKTLETRSEKYRKQRNSAVANRKARKKALGDIDSLINQLTEEGNKIREIINEKEEQRRGEIFNEASKAKRAEVGRELTQEEVYEIRQQSLYQAMEELDSWSRELLAENNQKTRAAISEERKMKGEESEEERLELIEAKRKHQKGVGLRTPEAIKAVEQEEKNIVYKPVEHLSIIDPITGEVLARSVGDKQSVKVPEKDEHKLRGNIVTHNHPQSGLGGTFSDADIISACKSGYAEIRAVAPGYRYSMKPPKNGWDASLTWKIATVRQEELNASYKEAREKIKQSGRRPSNRELRKIELEIHHKVWKKVAEETGMEYTVERIPNERPKPYKSPKERARGREPGLNL